MSEARDPNRINLSWLVRLRWGAVAGQLCTIGVVAGIMGIQLPFVPLLAMIGAEAALNVGCALWLRQKAPVREGHLAVVMAADVLILTGLLSFSGGSYNPFSFLYLVNIALAAVVLPTAWTWALFLLAAATSGALFSGLVQVGPPEDALTHAQHMQMHLRGMWIAFVVAAVFIVYFVSRVRRALAERERDLAAERAAAARHERLSSLATLAAGAAHELATPLGTIATVARELERSLQRANAGGDALGDVALIREQVERCRGILDQMSVEAGSPRADAPRPVRLPDLIETAVGDLADRVDVRCEPAATDTVVEAPARTLAQALRALVKNGLEASPEGARVRVHGRSAGKNAVVEIIDQGCGMSSEILDRVGEPFFTTKETGKGMGLGVFLARTVLERLGGSVALQSSPGTGTRATITLPAAALRQ